MQPSPSNAPLDIASDAAREATVRFALAHVRIWIAASADDEPVLAGRCTAQPHIEYGGFTAAHARIAMQQSAPTLLAQPPREGLEGSLPRGGFLGIPLVAEGICYGYVECYNDAAISFSEAAEIESWVNELACALASARATVSVQAPSRGHLLIADDDPAIRKLLETLLTRSGFRVTSAANGMLAYEAARKERFDLILLDWMMPVLTGPEAATKLKRDPQTRNVPIVMLTSQARIEDKVVALESGAQDYLTKPFDSRELVARIEQQLRWRALLSDTPAETTPPEVPAAPAAPEVAITAAVAEAPAAEHGEHRDPLPPRDGDFWSAAVAAQQLGKLRDALSYYVQEAEQCEKSAQYPRAAIAFRSASVVAGQLHNLDLSNKFLRLSGKMYLTWAEHSHDGKTIQDAYVNAARCFLSAGNLKLARKSVEIAESMHAVMADDRPSALQ